MKNSPPVLPSEHLEVRCKELGEIVTSLSIPVPSAMLPEFVLKLARRLSRVFSVCLGESLLPGLRPLGSVTMQETTSKDGLTLQE